MKINGMAHFEETCKNKLAKYCNIKSEDIFSVWTCKTLQNYKGIFATRISGDGILAEYSYNGDKEELYEDVYRKESNKCHKE